MFSRGAVTHSPTSQSPTDGKVSVGHGGVGCHLLTAVRCVGRGGSPQSIGCNFTTPHKCTYPHHPISPNLLGVRHHGPGYLLGDHLVCFQVCNQLVNNSWTDGGRLAEKPPRSWVPIFMSYSRISMTNACAESSGSRLSLNTCCGAV
jgi:hypothetical protein